MSNIPKLRFPEFTDAWEKCKLGEVAEIYDGTHQTPNYKKSGIMFLSVENIETMISDKFISEDDFKREFKTYPTSGDVLMTRIGDIGTVNIVNTNQRLAYYVSLALLKPKLVLSEYLKPLIESDLIQKELWKRTLHVAFPKKINKGEIEEIPIIHPTLPEQQKIGALFRRLDQLITLHKRKWDDVILLKKALLQKMFPKNGSDFPEIRFPEFTDAWEKCKLGEVFVQTAKFVNPDEQGLELWSLTIENGLTPKTERYNREFLVKKDDKYKLVSNNEFIYNPMNLTLGAIDLNRTGKKVCVSGYYITMTAHQDKYDNSYLLAWLRSYYAIQLYKNNATGSLKEKQRVQFPTFSKISTYSPSILEQQKIGALFRRLDRLITLHKRQHEHYQLLKKALLQQMFV